MRRLYLLLPDRDLARKVVDDLLLARIEWRHMHLIAREGIPLEGLPEAHLAQYSDLIPALERGAGVGAITGALAGLVAMSFPPAGLTLAGGALLFLTIGGAGFGAWMSSMVGVDLPNTRHQRFEKAIADGELLLLIDVPRERVVEIEALVRSHHPSADIQGVDATIPAFP